MPLRKGLPMGEEKSFDAEVCLQVVLSLDIVTHGLESVQKPGKNLELLT